MRDELHQYFKRQLEKCRVPKEKWGAVLADVDKAVSTFDEVASKEVSKTWKELRYGKGL